MINIPITKILFLDIETVGGCKDYQTCIQSNPKVANQFDKYFDWFLKRFPEDKELGEDRTTEEHMDLVFRKRSALVPEFAKIVCVSMAFVLDSGETKKQTFFFASGWNPPEQSGLSSFRWMCKKGVVAINPQLNTSKLVIDFDYPDNLKVFPSLSVSQNGVTLSVVNLTAGPQTVAVFLIPDEVNKTRLLTLEVSALFDAPGDPRELGLKVHNVRCE
jgi:hypothetical protein